MYINIRPVNCGLLVKTLITQHYRHYYTWTKANGINMVKY